MGLVTAPLTARGLSATSISAEGNWSSADARHRVLYETLISSAVSLRPTTADHLRRGLRFPLPCVNGSGDDGVVTGNKRNARRFKIRVVIQTAIGGALLAATVRARARSRSVGWAQWIEGLAGIVMVVNASYESWLNFTSRGSRRMDATMLRRYRRAGNLEGFEQILTLMSPRQRAIAINRLGGALEVNGELERAETVYQRAAELGDASAMVNVARMHYRREEYEPALLWFQRASSAGVDVPRLLGELLRKQGKTAAAIEAYRRAVKAGDDDLRATLGDLLVAGGEQAEGEAMLRAAAADGDPVAMKSLGRHLMKQGMSAEAEALFEQARQKTARTDFTAS